MGKTRMMERCWSSVSILDVQDREVPASAAGGWAGPDLGTSVLGMKWVVPKLICNSG